MSTDSGFRDVPADEYSRHADLCRRLDELNRKLDHVIAGSTEPTRPTPIPPEFLRLYDVARIINATMLSHQRSDLTVALAACHPVVANDPSSWRQQPKDSHA